MPLKYVEDGVVHTVIDDYSNYLYLTNFSLDDGTKIVSPNGEIFGNFGNSVSMDGDYAVVGAFEEDQGGISEAGAAYIFKMRNFLQ